MEIATQEVACGGDAQAEAGEVTFAPRIAQWSGRVKTVGDAGSMLSDLISDLIDDAITPQKGNAIVNATGKMLKAVEMRIKYGKPASPSGRRELSVV